MHKILKTKQNVASALYMQAHVYVGYNNEDIIYVESEGVWESGAPADHTGNLGEHSVSGDKGRVYLEELELERER